MKKIAIVTRTKESLKSYMVPIIVRQFEVVFSNDIDFSKDREIVNTLNLIQERRADVILLSGTMETIRKFLEFSEERCNIPVLYTFRSSLGDYRFAKQINPGFANKLADEINKIR